MSENYTRIILPDTIIEELILWRDTFSRGYFRIGDIACKLAGQYASKLNEKITSKEDLYNEIGRYCGKSGRTIRYYSEIAEFYPTEVRDEYKVLPFSAFAKAKEFADWKAILDLAADNLTWSIEHIVSHYISLLPSANGIISSEESDADDGAETYILVDYDAPRDRITPARSSPKDKDQWCIRKAMSYLYDIVTITKKVRTLLPEYDAMVDRIEQEAQGMAKALDDYEGKSWRVETSVQVDEMV
jgi:hypothetical protein